MASKIMFTVLVVIIAGAITAAVMMEPGVSAGDDESQTAQVTPAAATSPGPRADVQQSSAAVGIDVGNRAPQWTLRDARGQTHKLSDYHGQVVVMDFWATWCGPCKAVMPDLQKFHEQFAARGVNVIGINGYERGATNPAQYMADNDFTYGLMLNSDAVMRQYGANAIPMICVVGVDGEILYRHTGVLPNMDKELAKVVEPHLEEHGL